MILKETFPVIRGDLSRLTRRDGAYTIDNSVSCAVEALAPAGGAPSRRLAELSARAPPLLLRSHGDSLNYLHITIDLTELRRGDDRRLPQHSWTDAPMFALRR